MLSLTTLNKRLKAAEDYQKDNLRVEKWKMYLDWQKGKFYEGKEEFGQYQVNIIEGTVDILLPNLHFRRPYLYANPTQEKVYIQYPDGSMEEKDNYETSKLMEKVMNHVIKEIGVEQEVRWAVQDAVCPYGIGVVKVGYSALTSEGQMRKKENPWVKRVSPMDFFTDPFCTDPSINGIYTIHRSIVPYENVKKNELFRKVKLTPRLPDYIKDKITGYDPEVEMIELFEYHDLDSDKIYIFTIDGDKTLYEGENPYGFAPHFCVLKFRHTPDEFYSASDIDPVEDQIVEINKLHTKVINNLYKTGPKVTFETDALNPQQLEKHQKAPDWAFLEVSDINKVRESAPTPVAGEITNMINYLTSVVNTILGITEYQRGGGQAIKRTATEASYIQADSQGRREFRLKLVGEFYVKIAEKLDILIKDFMDEPRMIPIIGPDKVNFLGWDKYEVAGNHTYTYEAGSMTPQIGEVRLQQFLNTLQIIGSSKILAQPFVEETDQRKVIRRLFELFNQDFGSLRRDELEGGNEDLMRQRQALEEERPANAPSIPKGPPTPGELRGPLG